MEIDETHSADIREVKDIASLLIYFHHSQDWHLGIDSFDVVEDLLYDFSAADLGLKDEEFAKIKSLRQLPPLEEEQRWGIFCVEFDTEKFSVTALRKILSRLVPSRRNATRHAVWDERDLLFLCFWGTGNNRTVCVAHFESKDGGLASVRTIHCAPALEDPMVLKHFEDRLCLLQWPIDPSDYKAWHDKWSSAFTTDHGKVVKTSKDLAARMADVALRIKNDILAALAVETKNGYAHRLYEKVKGALLHSLNETAFADMYAQMIVYGLFTARCQDQTPDTFSASEALELIPNTNPFLKGLMRDCFADRRGDGLSFDELGIDDVVAMFSRVNAVEIANDFDKKSGGGREDPITYFYELFLKEYDKKIKETCGQYYTPKPVVGFMVRAVDYILKTRFNLPDGLATDATKKVKYIPDGKKTPKEKDAPAIQVLDPATGTGTFIREIILNIFETFKKNYFAGRAGTPCPPPVGSRVPRDRAPAFIEAWSRYVDRNVLPRLNAFELMMAPYAIAHMKLAMVLRDTGYDFKGDKRLQVYLTNSLEEPGNSDRQMTFFDDPLAAESVAANAVKKNTGINIVIGNPPYSGESQNKGAWIMKLMEDYKKEPGGKQKLDEKNPKWINDDYVKFIRFAQDFVERSGSGILAYINPHGFIDNPTFRGMRWRLMQTFDEIYVLNLHGNSKKKETCPDGSKDENVFDIQQGVSINIFVKNACVATAPSPSGKAKRNDGEGAVATHCTIHYADLYGLREAKYTTLEKCSLADVEWQIANPTEPMCFFVSKNFSAEEEYNKGFHLLNIFQITALGALSFNDLLNVSLSIEEQKRKIEDLKKMSEGEWRIAYLREKDSRDWMYEKARQDVIIGKGQYAAISYRPFDTQYTYYTGTTKGLYAYPRMALMRHLFHPNISMLVGRQGQVCGGNVWNLVFASEGLVDLNIFYRGGGNVFPLYLYQEYHGKMQKVPNLNPEIVKKIEAVVADAQERVPPEDIFNYIYAVLHSPTYRSKYKEFLKVDFPRIPYPTDAKTFHALAALGAQLVAIHTMKDFDEADDVAFDDAGGNEVVKVAWKDGAVYINKSSCFAGVERETFDQYIGGYQPLQKWLKDRKGRTLSADDISHYKRIVRALRRTAALMSEIDKLPVIGK